MTDYRNKVIALTHARASFSGLVATLASAAALLDAARVITIRDEYPKELPERFNRRPPDPRMKVNLFGGAGSKPKIHRNERQRQRIARQLARRAAKQEGS